MQEPTKAGATAPQAADTSATAPVTVTEPTPEAVATEAPVAAKPAEKTSKPAKASKVKPTKATKAATVKPAPKAKAAAEAEAPRTKKAPAKKAAWKEVAVEKPAKEKVKAKPVKAPAIKVKMVRDSFTMPSDDFELIDQVKTRALENKLAIKKSEVLRAALQALVSLPDAKLLTTLKALAPIKKGRPKKA